MITREEAIQQLYDLVQADVLNDEIALKLNGIVECIEGENDGLHLWGASDYEVTRLYTAYDEKEYTDELEDELNGIYNKYHFEPSPYEQELIDKEVAEAMEKASEEAKGDTE